MCEELEAVLKQSEKWEMSRPRLKALISSITVTNSWGNTDIMPDADTDLTYAMEENLRILPTYLLADGNTLVAWCADCANWHHHGGAGLGLRGGGIRIPHCDKAVSGDSYHLNVIGHVTLQIEHDLRLKRPRGPRFN